MIHCFTLSTVNGLLGHMISISFHQADEERGEKDFCTPCFKSEEFKLYIQK